VSDGPRDFAAGSVVAGYWLEEPIGQGALSAVYSAYSSRLDDRVALRVLAPWLARDEGFRRSFAEEWRSVAAAGDPHVIPVLEVGEEPEALFVAMRLTQGGDASGLLEREGPLAPGRTAELISQAAAALDAAHARGLVHRDLRPTSLLLDGPPEAGQPDFVYLSGFGLSEEALTDAGLPLLGPGSRDYAAPEQLAGRPADARADQYALACVAFELLTGAPPVRRDGASPADYAQVSAPPPLLSSRQDGLPAEADEVMSRALAFSPAYRYASCGEFAAELSRALGLDPAGTGLLAQPSGRSPIRFPAGVWRGAAGLAAGLGAGSRLGAGARPASRHEAVANDPARGAGDGGASQQPEPHPDPDQDPPEAWPYGPRSPEPRRPAGRHASARLGQPRLPRPGGLRLRWSSSAAAIASLVSVIIIGAVILLGRHQGGGTGAVRLAPLAAPGCTTATGRAPLLTKVSSRRVTVSGRPFAAQETPDHRFIFVSLGASIAVLRDGPGPSLLGTIRVPDAENGLAITPDGRYLLVAGGRGAAVISVARAERNARDPVVGELTSPRGSGAVSVVTSPDGRFAFVTLQHTTDLAVFSLSKALTSGFGPSDFVGFVPLGVQPVGLAAAPDGKWLYATSFQRKVGPMPSPGTLSVISLATAETRPARAVVAVADAGCSPARVITDGTTVWVTARDSDTLLAYSAARLLTDPARAIQAEVRVGPAPIGLTFAGRQIVVADSDLQATSGQHATLAVVSVAAALARRPALLGLIPAGPLTRQVALADGGKLVLATCEDSGQVQLIPVSSLP
jgi:DNA-binding beta-propeller fold protein YncE